MLFSKSKPKVKPGTPVVPVVELKGVIKPGKRSGFSRSEPNLNIEGLRGTLVEAFNTAGAVAIALDINCPGGSPTQSELIGATIRELAEEKGIPVYAFTQDVAASGGYWLACAADEIYSARTSLIGSIGVVNSGMGYHKLFEKIGVESRTYTAGAAKRRLDPAKPEKPEDVAWMQERLAKMHKIFKDWVMERRGDKFVIPKGQDKDTYLDENVFTGEVWDGLEAKELGLVDGIGYMEKVLTEKFGANVNIQVPKADKKGLLSLLTSFSSSNGFADDIGAAVVRAVEESAENKIAWGPYTFR